MDVYKAIISQLQEKKYSFKTFEHEPVTTSEEAAKVRNTPIERGAKAMVLRSEGKFLMVVISAAKQIDMKKMKEILHTKSLSFASAEEVMTVTGCEIGGVPPFGTLFGLPVFFDRSLLSFEKINFNAGLRTHSLEVNLEDYLDLVRPTVVEFAK
jgi:Ala-tRNA(Pro) deacylase